MVSVELRNSGQGLWSRMTLPTSVQMAQTLAATARQMNLADEVRIQPSGSPATEQKVDIRV